MLDLSNIPLTESILQACYKSKTYVRDGNWDILWYLGGKNNVTIGEKTGKYYLLPKESVETVVEILPFEFVQGQYMTENKDAKLIDTVEALHKIFPELNRINLRLKEIGR